MNPYNPTDLDRATAACVYDLAYMTPGEAKFLTPSDYQTEGACVTLKDGGATYWVVTLAEAKQIGIALDSCDTIQALGRSWIICLT